MQSGPAQKLAVLDVGSSSIHLLVAQVDGAGLTALDKHKRMVRLGSGTLARGRLDVEAMRRGLGAIAELAERAREQGAQRIVCVATSALREAQNGRAFVERAREESAVDIEILSGEEEGRLIYRGACATATGPQAVVDIGGGSVEIVAGIGDLPDIVHSLPLGVLRLREALVPADGYVNQRTVEIIAAAVRATAGRAVADVLTHRPERLTFTSGTARTIGRLAQELAGPFASGADLRAEAVSRLVVILTKLRPS